MRDLAPSPPTPASELACDVVVVGGGPGGCTAATLLARRGWSVVLVEKHRHPRFHIGESLLPMNLPIFARLGVLHAVAAIAVRKNGADFPAANERGYNVFRFRDQLDPAYPYAFQVRRSEFDELLFRHAAANGVHTHEDTEVSAVEFDEAGATCTAHAPSGTVRLRSRYVVDASGRDALLGTRMKLKRRHPRHQSAAMFAHFRGVERRPGDDAGNISIYRFEHGWVWVIPLRDGTTSIGAVGSPEWLKSRAGSRTEFLLDTLRSVPNLEQRLANAELVEHMNATGNYSYSCDRATGPRWILVGDAQAFLDPIFSSGVYLAMHSAERAVTVVDGALRDARDEARLQRVYEREAALGLGTLGWFIERFTTPAMRWLFANPRNPLRSANAMVSMLAGDVFRTEVRVRLLVFKAIYAVASLAMWREMLAHRRGRRRLADERFHGGTTAQDSG